LLLGLLVAPSRPAGLLALVAVTAFLARQPLRLLASDVLRRRAYPRTRWAAAFFVGFVLVAAFAFVLAAHRASSGFWPPEAERRELEARAEANGLPLSAMIKDDDRCIRCGLCAVRCPTDAMTMEKFEIMETYASPNGDKVPR
jgi:4Fe-4S binding domain